MHDEFLYLKTWDVTSRKLQAVVVGATSGGGGSYKRQGRSCKRWQPELQAARAEAASGDGKSYKRRGPELQKVRAEASNGGQRSCKPSLLDLQRAVAEAASPRRQSKG
jgi:hypothetical protein